MSSTILIPDVYKWSCLKPERLVTDGNRCDANSVYQIEKPKKEEIELNPNTKWVYSSREADNFDNDIHIEKRVYFELRAEAERELLKQAKKELLQQVEDLNKSLSYLDLYIESEKKKLSRKKKLEKV